ncbi:hypothetical protein FACS1894168_3860 [Deltaproteobacteria bacterium]|nr:hypothetical protein FACS1894168_3860 [Deltaproteobacteria bacterium]
MEASPDSDHAKVYSSLANKIYETTEPTIPSPLDTAELREWGAKWADQILALESGEIREKAAAI